MNRDRRLLDAFEERLLRTTPVDPERNRALIDALWDEARSLDVNDRLDPLENLEIDIRGARAINVHRAT